MRIKRFSFRNIFLIFVFLTVQLVAVNINSNSFVSEIRLEEESGISTSFPIDSIRSLSKTSSKKFIEYHMSDFTNESSKDFINAVVIFNEDVIWNFPDMTFTYKYKYLNGLEQVFL